MQRLYPDHAYFYNSFTPSGQNNKDATGTSMTVSSAADEDKSVLDMEIVPESALVGGIMVSNLIQDNASAAAAAAAGNLNAQGATGTGSKKEKKKKEKKFLRLAANTTWEDPTLAEWQQGQCFVYLNSFCLS